MERISLIKKRKKRLEYEERIALSEKDDFRIEIEKELGKKLETNEGDDNGIL